MVFPRLPSPLCPPSLPSSLCPLQKGEHYHIDDGQDAINNIYACGLIEEINIEPEQDMQVGLCAAGFCRGLAGTDSTTLTAATEPYTGGSGVTR